MHSYSIVNSLVHSTIAVFAMLVLRHLDEINALSQNKQLNLLIIAAVLTTLFRSSDALSQTLVEKIPFVSRKIRKLLAGRHHIEGDWPLVVIDAHKSELLYFGFLTITYEDGQLKVFGRDWHRDGKPAHDFESIQSLYDNKVLQYWYHQGQDVNNPAMRGYTEIYFFPKQAMAQRHAGAFLDREHTSDIRFYARKHDAKKWSLRPQTEKEQLSLSRQFWDDIQPNLQPIIDRPITTDWE